MSKPDIRAIVDLHIDFIAQNVSTDGFETKLQCHYTDGWGPSAKDPKGQEGLQDCLLDRYQLAAESISTPDQKWFDFTACLFRNQKETDTIDDNMKKFDATVKYCADVTGHDYEKLKAVAESVYGAQLLLKSHNIEKALNPFVDKTGHHHPDWILINGVDYGKNSTADWLQLVCDAYRGSPKPASCTSGVMV